MVKDFLEKQILMRRNTKQSAHRLDFAYCFKSKYMRDELCESSVKLVRPGKCEAFNPHDVKVCNNNQSDRFSY